MTDDERYKAILDEIGELKNMMRDGAEEFRRINDVIERLETGHTRNTCRIGQLERRQNRQTGFMAGVASVGMIAIALAGALGTMTYQYFDSRLNATTIYLHYLDDRSKPWMGKNPPERPERE